MNIYSSAPFLEALNKAYFPDVQLHLEDFLLQDRVWRLPTFPDGEPITGWQFIDFFEPVPSLQTFKTSKAVSYIDSACQGVVSTQECLDQNLFVPYITSPLIDWTNFATWDKFTAHVKSRRSKLLADARRCQRKLAKDVGSITFRWQDTREEVFDFCIKFKSTQFHSFHKLFAQPSNVNFFIELAKQGLLVVSSFSAGETLVAANLGALWQGRFYYWIPTYDPQYASYSPGRLMLLSILENSYEQKHQEFDFLIGREIYKWHYATHTRLISGIGGTWKNSVNGWLKKYLIRFPDTAEKLREIKIAFNFAQQVLGEFQPTNICNLEAWQNNLRIIAAEGRQEMNTHRQEYQYFLTQKSPASIS
ncbi:MAG: GNAT family N-acetyltransferase [Calothrix sp. MO_167.B42]|nr:GNAT family N-acetyltransferase [Calothrix sp. MO_167.B42]